MSERNNKVLEMVLYERLVSIPVLLELLFTIIRIILYY
nr:MAG TPA: hypothetical protein [Caudoviricetes sp.]